MNNTFRILWFEDEITWYRMERLRIDHILGEHYLIPDITRKNGDDFELAEICKNCYDLILMDFKLASGSTGDTIVAAIRESSVLTDILFYSSEETNMLSAIRNANPPIDGIYFTKRDYEIFTDKVHGLIDKIVKRSEDLVNLRGFVMDGSCDFEIRVQEILNIVWGKFTEAEKKILEDATQRNITRNEARVNETKEKVIGQKPVYPAAVNQPHFFSHTDRLYLLNKVISILQTDYGFQKDPIWDNFKKSYEDDISHYRNALGHKKAKEEQIEIVKGTFIPIDEELHQKMRKSLRQYDGFILELEKFVTNHI